MSVTLGVMMPQPGVGREVKNTVCQSRQKCQDIKIEF